MSTPQRFVELLECKELTTDSLAQFWPQIQDIAGRTFEHGSVDGISDFIQELMPWAYRNSTQIWTPETEDVFSVLVKKAYAKGSSKDMDTLFRAWTHAGSRTPTESHHRKEIKTFFSECDESTVTELLSRAPCLTPLTKYKSNKRWLENCVTYVRSNFSSDSADIGSLTFLYCNQYSHMLDAVQREHVNGRLVGTKDIVPTPFSWGPNIAKNHPNEHVLQLAFLTLALKIAVHPQRFVEFKDIAKEQCQQHLQPWLANNLPITPSEKAQWLAVAALLDIHAPGWIDPTIWEVQAPQEWSKALQGFSVCQSLDALEWTPHHSEGSAKSFAQWLKPLMVQMDDPKLVLPDDFSPA